jgi:hypothetical protein
MQSYSLERNMVLGLVVLNLLVFILGSMTGCFQSRADEAGRPFIEVREAEEVPFDLEEFMRYHAEC